ncbi:programmed cell death protein 2-like [Polymixia lowei]
MAASSEEALLGLCDGEIQSGKHSSSYLTNKVGGLPDVLPVVSWKHPVCDVCSAALVHVVQVYCPLAASPLHRQLHVFACSAAGCTGRPQSWKVLRSQCLESEVKPVQLLQPPSDTPAKVPMATTDWCDSADDWGMEEEEEEQGGVLCNKVSSHVDEKAADPEVEDPTTTELDVSCRLQDLTLQGEQEEERPRDAPVLRPLYISVVDEADLAGEDLEHAQELLREYEEREGVAVGQLDSSQGGGEEKYEKTKARHGDAVFSRFMKEISRCPEQILRYCWNGKPLFISEPPSNVAQMVPVCSSCGSPRTFEFQLMPALVSLLQHQDLDTDSGVEFGTVLVYTCRDSCWTSGATSPREEFPLIQADPDQQFFK